MYSMKILRMCVFLAKFQLEYLEGMEITLTCVPFLVAALFIGSSRAILSWKNGEEFNRKKLPKNNDQSEKRRNEIVPSPW